MGRFQPGQRKRSPEPARAGAGARSGIGDLGHDVGGEPVDGVAQTLQSVCRRDVDRMGHAAYNQVQGPVGRGAWREFLAAKPEPLKTRCEIDMTVRYRQRCLSSAIRIRSQYAPPIDFRSFFAFQNA